MKTGAYVQNKSETTEAVVPGALERLAKHDLVPLCQFWIDGTLYGLVQHIRHVADASAAEVGDFVKRMIVDWEYTTPKKDGVPGTRTRGYPTVHAKWTEMEAASPKKPFMKKFVAWLKDNDEDLKKTGGQRMTVGAALFPLLSGEAQRTIDDISTEYEANKKPRAKKVPSASGGSKKRTKEQQKQEILQALTQVQKKQRIVNSLNTLANTVPMQQDALAALLKDHANSVQALVDDIASIDYLPEMPQDLMPADEDAADEDLLEIMPANKKQRT